MRIPVTRPEVAGSNVQYILLRKAENLETTNDFRQKKEFYVGVR